jgi:hypothetical protein
MESFAKIISGINKTFFVTNTPLSNTNKFCFRATCIYIVYLKNETVEVFSAVTPTNQPSSIKQCFVVSENVVKAKIAAALYERVHPNPNDIFVKIRMVGQKGVKTFANLDCEVEIENHSHFTWNNSGGFRTIYTIVLKHYTSDSVMVLIGQHVGAGMIHESVRFARLNAERKFGGFERSSPQKNDHAPAKTFKTLSDRFDSMSREESRGRRFGANSGTCGERLRQHQRTQRFAPRAPCAPRTHSSKPSKPAYACSVPGREPNMKDYVDFDMTDKHGNQVYPPLRTKEEEKRMNEQMDEELDEYFSKGRKVFSFRAGSSVDTNWRGNDWKEI